MTTEQRIREMKELALSILDHAEKLSSGVGTSGDESTPKKLSEKERYRIIKRRKRGR